MGNETNIGQALLDAARLNQFDNAEKLLQQCSHKIPIVTDHDGQTAMHWAVLNNKPSMVKLLLLYHFNKNLPNCDYHTPIVIAAKLSYWRCVDVFMSYDQSSLIGGLDTALLYAVKAKEFISVKKLLLAGAKTDSRWTDTQFTPLHWAVVNQDLDMIKLLLNHGADQKLKDNFNRTALEWACSKLYWHCVIALCQKRLRFNHLELDRALLLACQAKQYQAAKMLLSIDANPNTCYSHEGRYPLHWAVVHNSPEMFALLIGAKAELSKVDIAGKTAIAVAVELNWVDIARWLKPLNIEEQFSQAQIFQETINNLVLRFGDREAFSSALYQDHLMPSPMTIAIAQNNLHKVEQLFDEGHAIDVLINIDGQNALDYAIAFEQTEIISAISKRFPESPVIEKAFLNACKNNQWQSAKAMDCERAMAMQLDAKYNKQLAWYSFSNTQVKAKFIEEAMLKTEKSACNKQVFFKQLSTLKTATYRQFMFWCYEPTNTTRCFQTQAEQYIAPLRY